MKTALLKTTAINKLTLITDGKFSDVIQFEKLLAAHRSL